MTFEFELPEIKVVQHAQAKRLKLAVSISGIRLTIPPFVSATQVEHFLQQSEPWLKQTWSKIQTQIKQTSQQVDLPDKLTLSYYDTPFSIEYRTDLDKFFIQDNQTVLIHQEHAYYALTQFVFAQAKCKLPNQLSYYAQQKKLNIGQIRIATPKTRWGSCSAEQHIMLHAGLLLMPEHYADYVLWHELTHTIHMHHQAGFWSQLEQFYSGAKAVQSQIRQFRLPFWWQTKSSLN